MLVVRWSGIIRCMKQINVFTVVAFFGCFAAVGEVFFKEDSVVLPTYAPGGYDKTPLFYTGRVYQGAQGRVYPYPMQDVLHDEKFDETYKYLTLENDWLQMGLLPEHGGHLLNFTDKATGFETFYRQHVIKPALIGMLGAWISGGVEWNFPHHHRATTAMPIDWRAVENADGSKTIWIGETELRRRLKWTIGLSLLPDRAVLKAENVFMNRQPWIESMIYWANVSVHCGDDYQILFPPSMHLGFDHHKNYWTSFPIGPRKEEVELLPSQRSKYADTQTTYRARWTFHGGRTSQSSRAPSSASIPTIHLWRDTTTRSSAERRTSRIATSLSARSSSSGATSPRRTCGTRCSRTTTDRISS